MMFSSPTVSMMCAKVTGGCQTDLAFSVPPNLLRSSLRTLVAQGSTTQRPFVEHIRKRLREMPPAFPDPLSLFPPNGVDVEQAKKERDEYLALTRCMFSCKLAQDSLP
jgi:hypothetical protein